VIDRDVVPRAVAVAHGPDHPVEYRNDGGHLGTHQIDALVAASVRPGHSPGIDELGLLVELREPHMQIVGRYGARNGRGEDRNTCDHAGQCASNIHLSTY